MLLVLRRVQSPLRTYFIKCHSVTTTTQRIGIATDLLDQLEQDGERILRVVRNRVEERAKLISQVWLFESPCHRQEATCQW
jgi:hypothetical protein